MSEKTREVRVTTLGTVCALLHSYHYYDFTEPLEVSYRMTGPDLQDEYFGYCWISLTPQGFSIDSGDGDGYYLTDEVMLWEFIPASAHGKSASLHIWFPANWSDPSNTDTKETH